MFIMYAFLALIIVSLGVLALGIDLSRAVDLHDVFDEDDEELVGH